MGILAFTTPLNLTSEKEKFFSSDSYEPQLSYLWEESEYTPSNKYQELFKAINSQNHAQISELAVTLFKVNLTEFADSAKKSVANIPSPLPKQDPELTKLEFEKAFAKLGLDYELKLTDEIGFNFRPQPKQKQIVMSRSADLSLFSVAGEIRHELAHLVRYENGLHNGIKRSSDYLLAEEGLASFVQDNGPEENYSKFQHAAEYLASAISMNSGFRELFNFLLQLGFSEELAWQRGIRHKFGFKDTSKAGDLIKPAMYYYHAQRVSQMTTDERTKLFMGKLSFADLEQHPEYRGKLSPEVLQEIFLSIGCFA